VTHLDLTAAPVTSWPSLSTRPLTDPPPLALGRPLPPLPRLRLHNRVVRRIRQFLEREGYVEIPVPTLTPAIGSCEIVDSMFTVDYFGTLAFPRQTGQLYLEEFVARGMDAVYCEGQSLRKEWKVDARHLTEFKLIEIEKRDMSLAALCDLQERLLKEVALHLSADEIGGAHVTRLDWMARWEHPRLTYREAIDLLRRHGFALSFGDDLSAEAEAALVRYCGNLPVHVTHFPEAIKFFNMKLDRADPSVVECVDYILPYAGETFGGSVREPDPAILRGRLHRGTMYTHLMDRASEFARQQWAAGLTEGINPPDLAARHCAGIEAAFAGYLGLFEEGPVERAGFGLGVARLLQYVTGLESVKDAIVFPTDRATFGVMP
jgi:asparaginyl-tRNA synthetase